MDEYSIKNTTKEQRIALIRSWTPEDEAYDDSSFDMWEMYRDYIDGKKEIAECNAAFQTEYMGTEDNAWYVKEILEDDFGCEERQPGEPLMCIVKLFNNWGEEKQVKVAEKVLNERQIRPGMKMPEDV